MIEDDDDDFLYGDAKDVEEPPKLSTTVPQPISLEQIRSTTEGLIAHLEAEAASVPNGESAAGEAATNGVEHHEQEEEKADEEEEEEEEEEDSDDDIEIIMDQPSRSLDFRNQVGRQQAPRSTNGPYTTPTKAPQQPQPSLTTEYTPRDRSSATKLPSTPQPSGSGAHTAQRPFEGDAGGPDPSTLPPVTAPPSHPTIDPDVPGTLDGRSILEVDLNALADKPWRRPGSDISDWFNYGFDELSWEAYCHRRRETGEIASMLRNNVLNFAGMPEDQLSALPAEIRTMVVAGAMMTNGGAGPNGGGMMQPGTGMNMNGAMLNQIMGMNGMMNPMMDMGVGMNGDMGMGMGAAGPGMPMGSGMGGGPGPGMMQDGGGPGMGVGGGPQGGTPAPEQTQVPMGMGVGDGFGAGGGGPGMMGMGMGGEFPMQDPSAMGPQMYPNMEGSGTPGPVAPTPPRGGAPVQFRGRGIPQGMGMRGVRAVFPSRGRAPPVRPASPLPPNVPTGPRNKNKYKDIDGSAPAVDGLDYGGGGGGGGPKESGRGTPDQDDRNSRKRRISPGQDDGRGSKRR